MVLSRKKLKEKLRSLLTESLASSESKNSAIDGTEEVSKQLESVRQRLKESKSKRTSRPKQKKKPPLNDVEGKEEKKEGEAGEEGEEEAREVELGSGEKKAVKKEKKKKEKKKNKKKNRKEEVNNEEKEKGVNKNALEIASGEKERCFEHKALERNPSVNLAYLPEREENAKKVYVGGIPYYSTEDDIKSFFEGCGTVSDIDCMKFPETGKFRGIAILTFKTEAAAKRAISLDGSDMGGFYLKIQPYKGKSANKTTDFSPQIIEGYHRIYIGNLSWDVTEDDLKNLFENCKIASIRFGTDKSTGDFKGYAHVDFQDSDSLAKALELDQKAVRGRPVRIRCAVPRKAHEDGNDPVKKASSDGNDVITKEENGDKIGEEAEVHKKQKRRTCYECGIPGHLSSACPNRKTNADSSNTATMQEEDMNITREEEEAVDTTQEGSVRKKQKRRTCYECGTPGHLSSACPNKKSNVDGADAIVQQDIQKEDGNKIREEEQGEDIQGGSARKKKKRRTCYECGTPGHLSSECPNRTS